MFNRATTLALGLAALGCLLLAATRAFYDISFVTPLQLTTSGAEEEALYSVWCFAHGQTVFTDPLQIPYTGSYFNWLFYALYGSIAGTVLRSLHLDDAWLPTICRITTIALTCLGAAVFAWVLRGAVRRMTLSPFTVFCLAVIAAFNPLCGLWLLTTRPDMGAAVFELAGVAFFIRYWRDERIVWIVLAALAFYIAWSFKQVSLAALPGAGLTLVLLRRWRAAFVLGGIWLAAVVITLVALGPIYRHGLLGAQAHLHFSVPWGLKEFAAALVKMPFIPPALGGIAWVIWRRKRLAPPSPVELALTLIMLGSLGLEAIASCKDGSADYYFIPLAIWSPLWLAVVSPRFTGGWRNGLFGAAAVVMILGLASVLSGLRGTFDNRDPLDHYGHLKRYLATRPGPVLVRDTYGDLPWISPTEPHFVIEFNYGPHFAAGYKYEDGGVEALVNEGYFTTIVDDPTDPADDDQRLAVHYRLARTDLQMRYFERK